MNELKKILTGKWCFEDVHGLREEDIKAVELDNLPENVRKNEEFRALQFMHGTKIAHLIAYLKTIFAEDTTHRALIFSSVRMRTAHSHSFVLISLANCCSRLSERYNDGRRNRKCLC